MIELYWKNKSLRDSNAYLIDISKFFVWFTTSVVEKYGNQIPLIDGYLVFYERDIGYHILFYGIKPPYQEILLKHLQQPPEEFKERYIACVVQKENTPCEDEEDRKEETVVRESYEDVEGEIT